MTVATSPKAPRRAKRTPGREATVLYDAPGPVARMRNRLLTVAFSALLLLLGYIVWRAFNERGEFAAAKWSPFLESTTWTTYILPGIRNTLTAAALAAVGALVFGAVFGIARLSDHAWVRLPAGTIVEFFRAVPLLMLMFFAQFGGYAIFGVTIIEFNAVVIGLILYNGSVLAEIVRAGINAVPRGQSEAAYAVGLRKNQVMRIILLPQAVTAMMPAIVSQLVVLLKDTALGFIIAYPELVSLGVRQLSANYGNILAAIIVVALLYIAINSALGLLATWLEKRTRRSRKTAAEPITAAPSTVETGLGGGGAL